MDEADEMAHLLERVVRDPMADALPGSVRITSATQRVGKARYQTCELEVIATAPGIPATSVTTEVVTSRRYWPVVGAVLPARISVSDPKRLEIDWDALANQQV